MGISFFFEIDEKKRLKALGQNEYRSSSLKKHGLPIHLSHFGILIPSI